MSLLLNLGHLVSLWHALGLLVRLVGDPKQLPILAAMCARRPKSKVTNNFDAEEEDPSVFSSSSSSSSSSSLLDLPELAIDSILSELPPKSLAAVCCVSKELYKKSSSNLLWLPHVQSKWGCVAGTKAYKEWQSSFLPKLLNPFRSDELTPLCKWPLPCIWSPWTKSTPDTFDGANDADSYMKWFITLETGGFWFPAQVYNREHGHVGFLLSCYDAEVRYDRKTNTFDARYPPHGSCSPLVEEGISWDRLRAAPISVTSYELYMPGPLQDLRPGDHVEVQWRRNKKFPYGWWYGIVGHLDTCDKNSYHCRCHLDDMLWLEFLQYAPGSRWRRTCVNRHSHTEKGTDNEGFYAGIRKLQTKEEVSNWRELWPGQTLD